MALRHAAMLEVNEFLVLDFIRGHERTSRPKIGRLSRPGAGRGHRYGRA